MLLHFCTTQHYYSRQVHPFNRTTAESLEKKFFVPGVSQERNYQTFRRFFLSHSELLLIRFAKLVPGQLYYKSLH
jgi:hypothetical protein